MPNFFGRTVPALTLSLALAAVPALAAPSPAFGQEDHHDVRDYSHDEHRNYQKDRYYRLGNREGYKDYQRHAQRPDHNHDYRSDADRHAHDYGYYQGYQGHRGYTPDGR